MPFQASFDIKIALANKNTYAANSAAVTFSGAYVDLQGYVNPGGRNIKAFLDVAYITSTGTITVKMQEADSTAVGSFTDITGATFTTIANTQTTASTETIHFRTTKRYVRAIGTIADTGNANLGVYILAEKRLT